MRNKSLVLLTLFFAMISILVLGGCSDTQTKSVTSREPFPNRPITMIVPFSVGGGLDLTARALEKGAVKHLGQPLVVVNKPGGAGTIGWNELATATPDGYTISMTGADMLFLPLYGPTKYNYPTALEPLIQVSASPVVLAVQADQPWQTLEDLIDYARNNPGELKFGHSGVGSFPHVIGEMFGQKAGINIKQVPFGGAGEVTAALLGGHVQIIFVNSMLVKEHVKNGKIKILAVTGENRLDDPIFSEVPTFKEVGLDILLKNWYGVAAPKDMPVEVKTKLEEGLKKIVMDSDFQQGMNKIGLQVDFLDSNGSKEKWLKDGKTFDQAIHETGILDLIKAQKK